MKQMYTSRILLVIFASMSFTHETKPKVQDLIFSAIIFIIGWKLIDPFIYNPESGLKPLEKVKKRISKIDYPLLQLLEASEDSNNFLKKAEMHYVKENFPCAKAYKELKHAFIVFESIQELLHDTSPPMNGLDQEEAKRHIVEAEKYCALIKQVLSSIKENQLLQNELEAEQIEKLMLIQYQEANQWKIVLWPFLPIEFPWAGKTRKVKL